jgi:hypothetical protein
MHYTCKSFTDGNSQICPLNASIDTNLLTCVITGTCNMGLCEEKCVKILVQIPELRSMLYVWHMDNIKMAV